MTLRIPQRGNKPSRLAVIAVKYASGFIPIKSSSLLCGSKSSCSAADKVRVCAIRAEEIDPPPNIESIDWTLLTNVPVNNMDDALEKIKWYRLRWKVEEYFRVLKSGCKIEASRLSTTARLQRLIAIKSIIAFKILYLSKVALAN